MPASRSLAPLVWLAVDALITAPDSRDPAMMAKLDAVAGRVLGAGLKS